MNRTLAARPDTASRRPGRREKVLARFEDVEGGQREVVAKPARGGRLLVIDRDRATREDRRVVGVLEPDEAAGNEELLARLYAQDAATRRVRCRPHDQAGQRGCGEAGHLPVVRLRQPAPLVDDLGRSYSLARLSTGMSIPEVRWVRRGPSGTAEIVSVREVVAAMESYEAPREATAAAIAAASAADASTATLRAELARVLESPIVLNCAVRAAVLSRVSSGGASMSEIAIRCGRCKRDRGGTESGDTSWLARRIGILPEGGQRSATPWIHSEVLALIARSGLALSPREVEAQ